MPWWGAIVPVLPHRRPVSWSAPVSRSAHEARSRQVGARQGCNRWRIPRLTGQGQGLAAEDSPMLHLTHSAATQHHRDGLAHILPASAAPAPPRHWRILDWYHSQRKTRHTPHQRARRPAQPKAKPPAIGRPPCQCQSCRDGGQSHPRLMPATTSGIVGDRSLALHMAACRRRRWSAHLQERHSFGERHRQR